MADKIKNKKKTQKTRSDTAVQGTSDNSIVSKYSAVARGYVQDDYLQYLVAKPCRRAPLINRGYYIRAKAVDHVFETFLHHYSNGNQVLGLGAGFDSAYFRLSGKGLLGNTVYFEIDFPEVVARKCALIKQREPLAAMVKDMKESPVPQIALDSCNYKLLGVDLTNLPVLNATLSAAGFDPRKPTLLLSEVVLTYMSAESSSKVIQWASATIENGLFLTYEQIYPDDSFGRFMLKHFVKIGSTLRTIGTHPTLRDQIDRYHKLGWTNVTSFDVNYFFQHILDTAEKDRMSKLEPFDEYEEWHLKCAHYMILTAYRGQCIEVKELVCPAEKLLQKADANGEVQTEDGGSLCDDDELPLPVIPLAAFDSRGLDLVMDEHSLKEENKRFGHTANMIKISDDTRYVLVIGGFGQSEKDHGRISTLQAFNVADAKQTPMHVRCSDGKNSAKFFESLYHTVTVLGRGDRAVIFGGRLSPFSPRETDTLTLMTFSKAPIYEDADSAEKESTNESTENDLVCSCDVLTPEGAIVPCPRWRHTATAVMIEEKEYILVYGGRNDNTFALGDCYLLDTSTWMWSEVKQAGSVPEPRHSHTADVWGERLLLSGGLSGAEVPQATIHSLNINDWAWEELDLAGTLRPRYSHTSAVVQGFLFLVGGVSTSYPPAGVAVVHLETKTVQEYDWRIEKSPAPIVMVHNHCSVLLEDDLDLVVIGGGGNCFSFGTHLNEVPTFLDLNYFIEDMKKRLKA